MRSIMISISDRDRKRNYKFTCSFSLWVLSTITIQYDQKIFTELLNYVQMTLAIVEVLKWFLW